MSFIDFLKKIGVIQVSTSTYKGSAEKRDASAFNEDLVEDDTDSIETDNC